VCDGCDLLVVPIVQQIKPTLSEAKQRTEIEFQLGDATLVDWSDATMWFANSTCFDEELMRKLAVVAGASTPYARLCAHADTLCVCLAN
jgi:hypothetical protein